MRSADVERAIAALAVAIARQEGELSHSERRFHIERGITFFIENQMAGGSLITLELEDLGDDD